MLSSKSRGQRYEKTLQHTYIYPRAHPSLQYLPGVGSRQERQECTRLYTLVYTRVHQSVHSRYTSVYTRVHYLPVYRRLS